MQCTITGSYLIFGLCEKYSEQLDHHKPTINADQVKVSRSKSEYEETQTSILNDMIIEDEVPMEVQEESD